MTHVDIVKNEWLAGYQLLVARLWTEDGDLRIKQISDAEPWSENTVRSFAERVDPETLIATLHEHIAGDYLFATEPHDEADCPYAHERVPLEAAAG